MIYYQKIFVSIYYNWNNLYYSKNYDEVFLIRLLHFSDIHFKHPECLDLDTDPNTSIRDKLSSDIQEHCSKDGKNVDAILITGDIAFEENKKNTRLHQIG